MHALEADSGVPWHRVVNARGQISARGEPAIVPLQRSRLEAEGIAFGAGGGIDLARFGWRPRAGATGSSKRAGAARRSRGSQA